MKERKSGDSKMNKVNKNTVLIKNSVRYQVVNVTEWGIDLSRDGSDTYLNISHEQVSSFEREDIIDVWANHHDR